MGKMNHYIPEATFDQLVAKCHLKVDSVPYIETIRAFFLPHPIDVQPIDFQVFVPSGKRYCNVRIIYGCDENPLVAAFDYKGGLPDSLNVDSLGFYYSWVESHANID